MYCGWLPSQFHAASQPSTAWMFCSRRGSQVARKKVVGIEPGRALICGQFGAKRQRLSAQFFFSFFVNFLYLWKLEAFLAEKSETERGDCNKWEVEWGRLC